MERIKLIFISVSIGLSFLNSSGQQIGNYVSNDTCDDFKSIDKLVFARNNISGQTLVKYTPENHGHFLQIRGKDTNFYFVDEIFQGMDGHHLTYTLLGQDTVKHWALIKRSYLTQECFYLLHLNTNKIDTLIGSPVVYQDHVVCVERTIYNSTGKIVVWQIRGEQLLKLRTFNPDRCGINNVSEIYLKNRSLYISTAEEKYYRVDL